LRGPQGTLFGRNSTGGLAHFITAKPTDTLEGYAEAGVGDYSQWFLEGAVSGPISDRVRGRLAGRAEEADGWWKNRAPGGEDTFAKKFGGVRGHLEVDLSDNLLGLFSLGYDRNRPAAYGTYKAQNFYVDENGRAAALPADLDAFGTGPGNNVVGYRDPYGSGPESAFDDLGSTSKERLSPTVQLDWNVGDLTVTSLTNYTDFKMDYSEEDDGSPIEYIVVPKSTQDLKQWSQELRLTGNAAGVDWTTGLYYLDIDQNIFQRISFPVLAGEDFAYDSQNEIVQETKTIAAFGQLEWMLTDVVRMTFGARYTRDEKTFDSQAFFNELGNGYEGGVGSTVFSPPLNVYDFSESTVGSLAKIDEDLWSGKLQFDYLPSDRALFYASVSRGVKGGGFNTNLGAGLSIDETRFDSESVISYEIGSKLDFLDNRLRINSSIYYYDYSDFQGYAITTLTSTVSNYDGEIYGAELEVNAVLPGDIRLDVAVAYVETELRQVPTAYAGILNQESVLAPNWTANGALNKEFRVGADSSLEVQWSFDYLDERYTSVDNNAATLLKSSFIHNARVSYLLEDMGLEFAASVNNIGDEHREVFSYDNTTSSGYRLVSLGLPRWWGISVRKSF